MPDEGPIIRQASCVAITDGNDAWAIMLEGAPGSGKSSLALALIDRGAVLVGDDGVTLQARDGVVWVSPPPNIAGKLEIRGVGIVDMPTTSAPLALVLTLGTEPKRYIERAATTGICGIPVPTLPFFADSPVAAIRAEYALALHGLAAPRHAP